MSWLSDFFHREKHAAGPAAKSALESVFVTGAGALLGLATILIANVPTKGALQAVAVNLIVSPLIRAGQTYIEQRRARDAAAQYALAMEAQIKVSPPQAPVASGTAPPQ